MSNYITLEEFKYTAELTGFSFADGDIPNAIGAASRGIDEYCGRKFYTDATTRYYTPVEPGYLRIDDLVTLGTMTSDLDGDGVFEQTWTLNTDFVLEPLNAAADGKPYEEIRLHPAGSLRFSCYPRSVSVSGTFGWAATPAPVKEATTILASRLLRRAREAPFGVVGIGIDNAAVRIARTDPDVAFLLDPFIRGAGMFVA